MTFKIIRNVSITLYILVCWCHSADLVFLDVSPELSVTRPHFELICQFFGLNVEYLDVGNGENDIRLGLVSKWKGVRAIMISERALSKLDLQTFLHSLPKEAGKSIPLLIWGVTHKTKSSLLSNWSNGAVMRCARDEVVPLESIYRISNEKILTRQVACLKIPFNSEGIDYFILSKNQCTNPIIQVERCNNAKVYPIFIKILVTGQELFFLTKLQISGCSSELTSKFNRELFLKIAPLMMFLRYACGERCWHSPNHYANLTIDDPWLTEPYGHLTYVGLLEEMKKSNFCITIAFIPWNYDRSQTEVVSLFSKNSDRLSICIHGNNHDHYEFYKYETKPGDPWPAKSLDVQDENIKQALARMARFKNLTGFAYDKVMVFPYGIAPNKTLGLLKKYNFLATVNAGNVPLGSEEPEDLLFRLRSVTLKFENFPSLNRYSPSRTRTEIAIDLFLDNPLLFYGHHDLFKDGIDAFNETAEMVNNIQPDIIWESLGYICQHLYLEKLRDDGHYDLLAFSSNFTIDNDHQRDLTYFVQKEESFSVPIRQVIVDGDQYSYKKSESNLLLEISIPAGESRHICIDYENELDLSLIDISKNNPQVNRLRRHSDFRDITLSRNVFGRILISVYYDTGLYKFGLIRLAISLGMLAILMILVTLHFIKRKKRQKKASILKPNNF